MEKLQGVGRCRIERFVDDFQIDELFVHRGPEFWIHLTRLRASWVVSMQKLNEGPAASRAHSVINCGMAISDSARSHVSAMDEGRMREILSAPRVP